ncbi:MAG: putative zinc-binding metallopeptidase [Prevotella sp.]|nr:putative zinc-binding metallopeptidase [Prevotella sp.]
MLLMAGTFGFSSCSDEDLNPVSVFDSVTKEEKNEFDNWLEENYRKVYNIDFKYRYSDKESDLAYNVTPAEFDKSKALAILVKHIWLEAYAEAAGIDFMKSYVPRIIQLTGSYKWNTNGSQVLGTAEGGLKIMFYGVNELDIDNPRINTENPYESHQVRPIDMNYWFFHTMHHEFCHILTQKKEYDISFRAISAANYHATDWINLQDKRVAKEGFVTSYAASEYNEDFAELYATYITNTPEGWQLIIDAAGDAGTAILNQKLDLMKEYFKNSWNINLDTLRNIVLRRSGESTKLDLRTLK